VKTKNIPLLRKTMEFMKAHPGVHDQAGWIGFGDKHTSTACHTTMCTAGHAAVLSGADIPTLGQFWRDNWRLTSEGRLAKGESGQHVSQWAKEQLGFNDDEEWYIFMCLSDELVFERIEEVLSLWENGQEFVRNFEDYDEEVY